MGSVNSFTISHLGIISSVSRWNCFNEVRVRDLVKSQANWSVRKLCVAGYLGKSQTKVTALSGFEGYSAPEKLEPLWDDGYGSQSVKDYLEIAKEMIKSDDDDGPRWFCPIECGVPIKDSPLLLYLPGLDGLGLGLILHHKALGKVFQVRCMHIPVNDRTPFEGLMKFVEDAVRLENASSSKKKPIYLIGDSLGACIALSVAARNPTIDLVLILVNPATSYSRSNLQYFLPMLEASPDKFHTLIPYLYGLNSGNPFKMAMVSTVGISPFEKVKQAFNRLTTFLPQISDLADMIPMDFYVWKVKMLKSAAAYANSHLHAVKAQVLILASNKDNMFPSQDEAIRLSKLLQNCITGNFSKHGHALLMEDGFRLLSIIKSAGIFRRKNRIDIVRDFLPPSLTEFKQTFDYRLGWFRELTSPVMYSTLDDGTVVRGLGGVPKQGPVLYVGYHMLLGAEIHSIIESFLKEKNILVRGLTHPEMFTENFKIMYDDLSNFDVFRVYGGIPVSGRNLFKLFEDKSHVLLYPGGIREALHRKNEYYKLFWPQQPEFVRMAMKFGVTIVPFGVTGADDIFELFFDYNDQMRIPFLENSIRNRNQRAVKLRNRIDLESEELSQQHFHVPGFYIKKPGRFYYLFGKPIETKNMVENWKDEHAAKKLYLDIKSQVEQHLAYLLEKREQDPFRDIYARAAYCAFTNSSTVDIPSFNP